MEDGQNGEPMANVTNRADGERNIDLESALTLSQCMVDATVLVVLNSMHLAK